MRPITYTAKFGWTISASGFKPMLSEFESLYSASMMLIIKIVMQYFAGLGKT
jgi:hypothetical protein